MGEDGKPAPGTGTHEPWPEPWPKPRPQGSGASSGEEWIEAPPPPGPQGVTAGEVVAGTAVVVGLMALDAVSGGVIGALAALPGGRTDDYDGPPLVVPPDLHRTAAPVLGADGLVACTRCQRRVAFASMSINEHGYFCASCGPSQPL